MINDTNNSMHYSAGWTVYTKLFVLSTFILRKQDILVKEVLSFIMKKQDNFLKEVVSFMKTLAKCTALFNIDLRAEFAKCTA